MKYETIVLLTDVLLNQVNSLFHRDRNSTISTTEQYFIKIIDVFKIMMSIVLYPYIIKRSKKKDFWFRQ